MKSLILIIFCFIMLFNTNILKSQNACDDNTGYATGSASWSVAEIPGEASVDYKYKSNSATNKDIKIDWSTFVKTSNPLLEDEMLKELLIQEILRSVAGPPGVTTTVNFYYKKECSARLKSIVLLSANANLDCCPNGVTVPEGVIQEKIVGLNNRRVIYNYKSVPCGEKCCKKVYNVYKDYDRGKIIYSISGPSTFSVENCDTNSSYTDCETNQPIPCESPDCSGYGE